jgi:AraC-like DNA-binding protein
LLSAIDSEESLIKGFNTGADDYIVKPFNESLLIRRIQNLIDAQSRIKNKYGQYSFSAEELNIEDHSSKEFINKLIKVIHENASSENHSLDKIAEDMNLSRSSLYRKIKDMTGMKAIDFMKKVRLQFAAKLLVNRDYTVNEVAWRTGFSDTKYFSKCFYKEYGLVPSKFRSGRSAYLLSNPASRWHH